MKAEKFSISIKMMTCKIHFMIVTGVQIIMVPYCSKAKRLQHLLSKATFFFQNQNHQQTISCNNIFDFRTKRYENSFR
jgi:hypothetical protein